MRFASLMASGLLLGFGGGAADATVSVAIDLTHQRMHVVASRGTYDWPVSSARSGFYTPGGSFAPTHLERMHYSKKYHMSPMPYSIFFRGGYAIHGTYATGALGRPASHGCVRLSPGHAAALYRMVQSEGARISISGTPPSSHAFRPDEARRSEPEPRRREAGRRPRVYYGSVYQPYMSQPNTYPYDDPPAYAYPPQQPAAEDPYSSY